MNAEEPLAGLDHIRWHDVVTWDGTGESIPQTLRALDGDDHAAALCRIEESIGHQSGIVPATVFAIPFLGRLLLAGRCRDPKAVAALLRTILAACRAMLVGRRANAEAAGALDLDTLLLPADDPDADPDAVFAKHDLATWALRVEADIVPVLLASG